MSTIAYVRRAHLDRGLLVWRAKPRWPDWRRRLIPPGGRGAIVRPGWQSTQLSDPLLVPSSESELWAWLSALDAPPPESLAAAAQSRLPPGVRIAAGRPAAGLAGFRTTHAEAVAAARVAVLAADDAPALTLYDDVELVALLSADLDRARAFVAHELGALAGSSPAIARLRETAGWPSGASSSRRR